MLGIVGGLNEDPKVFYDLMKVRDLDGDSIFNHFITTKQYNVMETRAVQQAVTILWLGSVTAGSPFMQNSTAY